MLGLSVRGSILSRVGTSENARLVYPAQLRAMCGRRSINRRVARCPVETVETKESDVAAVPLSMEERVRESTRLLHGWLVAHDFSAFDPFEGLNSWLRPLAFATKPRQVLQKSIRMSPLDPRPVLGIKPHRSTKAIGYLVRAYLKLERADPGRGYAQHAREGLRWLVDHASPGWSGLAWGNDFDYQSRLFYLPKGEPTVVWTALIGHAFLDAWEQLGEERWLKAAESVVAFIMGDLEHRAMGDGLCISYIPAGFTAVHNANVLAAGFLARTALHSGDAQSLQVARQAVDYTVAHQHEDGSWWYGEKDDLHWVDNFHTGYVLDSLWWYMLGSGDTRHVDDFVKGASFYVHSFFLPDGLPKYYPERWWPADIQCAAQAIETLTLLSALVDPGLLDMAERTAQWTIDHMQMSDGHFAYQKWPLITNRTPMLHWGQATMMHALACLLTEMALPGA